MKKAISKKSLLLFISFLTILSGCKEDNIPVVPEPVDKSLKIEIIGSEDGCCLLYTSRCV